MIKRMIFVMILVISTRAFVLEPLTPEWAKFRNEEYLFTAGAGVAALSAMFLMTPRENGFTEQIEIDESTRDFLRARTPEGQALAMNASDISVFALVAIPTLVDAGIVTAGGKGQGAQAWQMLMIDAESFAVTNAIGIITKNLVGRERPYVRNCNDPLLASKDCGTKDADVSFFSAHSANAFTAAGLICFQHNAKRIYGNEILDNIACYSALAIASATGGMRIMADKHYLSDVLTGAVVGLASGLLMPMLLRQKSKGKQKTRSFEISQRSDISNKKTEFKLLWHF